MRRFLLEIRRRTAAAGACAVLAVLASGAAPAASAPSEVFHGVDTGVCPFPLEVTVTSRPEPVGTTALKYRFVGPSTITLRNAATGRRAVVRSPGSFAVDTATGDVRFTGRQVWYWSTTKHVPFLATDGEVGLDAPDYVLARGGTRARVIDPCALVAPSPPSTRPATTPAPWGLPRYPLSRIAYAGLTPVLGNLIRHDHAHLDVIVNRRHVTVPAGVGQAEPVDAGPCPRARTPVGDCSAGHVFAAAVANSPLHTHTASGIIHIESDRPRAFTLGEFFDEWGVRLDSRCIGGYCAGGGEVLRVFVGGRRVTGDLRRVVLRNHEEIAVLYGRRGALGPVPSAYRKGWPGPGCGGPHEQSCRPSS